MIRLHLCVPTCALALVMSGTVDAGFTFSSNLTNLSVTGNIDPNSGESVGGLNSSGTLSGTTMQTLLSIGASSTTPPPGSITNLVVSFTDTITITNIPPSGIAASGNIVLNVVLTFSQLDSQSETSTLTLNGLAVSPGPVAAITVGGVNYTLSNFAYNPPPVSPTVGGSLTAIFNAPASAVPEPASVAMMGVGMAGVAILARRRKLRSA